MKRFFYLLAGLVVISPVRSDVCPGPGEGWGARALLSSFRSQGG